MHGFLDQGRADPIERQVAARTLDRQFTLQTPDLGVFEAVRFLDCTPDIAGPPPHQVTIAIEPYRSYYRIVENGAVIKEVFDAQAVVGYLHAHLFRCSIEDRPRAALLHAACLRRGDCRLLLVGPKGTGKTTLSLRLIQSGYEIEGDEHVLLDRAGVIARPRGCRVRATALQVLASMADVIAAAPSYADDASGIIFNVDPRTLGSTWRIEQGQVDIVILLHPNHGGHSSIRSLPPSAAVQLLIPEIGLREGGHGSSIAALVALTTRAKAFDLSLGEHAEAVRCVELALDACGGD